MVSRSGCKNGSMFGISKLGIDNDNGNVLRWCYTLSYLALVVDAALSTYISVCVMQHQNKCRVRVLQL